MLDTLSRLLERWTSEAYDPAAILFELLLIGLAVNWCAGVLRGTRGTRMLRGLLIVLVVATLIVRLLSVQMGWTRLELLYRYFVIALAFIALVAFQPELRRAFLRAGDVRWVRRGTPQAQLIATLVEAAGRLARHKHGALIAVQRDVGLRNWAEHGVRLDAEVSADLLTSIFFPNSPLHDMGVIIQDTRVLAANCQFPQAEAGEADPTLGSRHRAAVALSNESDALVLVVSEESGAISLADHGNLLRKLALTELNQQLQTRLGARRKLAGNADPSSSTRWLRVLRRAAIVLPVTAAIWYVTDQASLIAIDDVKLAVAVAPDPELAIELEPSGPATLNVSLRGPTRSIERLRREAAAGPLRLDWTLPSASRRPGRYDIPAQSLLEQIPTVRGWGVEIQRVAPEVLSVNVDRLVSLTLPIRVNSGAARVEDVQLAQPEARVWLRQKDLERLGDEHRNVAARMAERLGGVPTGQVRSFERVPLDRQLGPISAARIEPAEIDVTLRVVGQSVEKRISGVVVQFAVSPQFWQRFDVELRDPNEWLIDLMVDGERSLVEPLRPSDVRAFVTVTSDSSVNGEFRAAEVQIITPQGVRVVGPGRQVQFRVLPRGGASP